MNLLLSRKSLAEALEVSESTVDDFVRRGILPKPLRLSSGCVRWRLASIDQALASLEGGSNDAPSVEAATGVQRAIEAAKERRRGRSP